MKYLIILVFIVLYNINYMPHKGEEYLFSYRTDKNISSEDRCISPMHFDITFPCVPKRNLTINSQEFNFFFARKAYIYIKVDLGAVDNSFEKDWKETKPCKSELSSIIESRIDSFWDIDSDLEKLISKKQNKNNFILEKGRITITLLNIGESEYEKFKVLIKSFEIIKDVEVVSCSDSPDSRGLPKD